MDFSDNDPILNNINHPNLFIYTMRFFYQTTLIISKSINVFEKKKY
jgi:hypothetical protein